jgi:hypothetical protein
MTLHRTEITKELINQWRGLPEEYGMLKGALCLDFALARAVERAGGNRLAQQQIEQKVQELVDPYMLAERMDEIRSALLQRVKAYKEKQDGILQSGNEPA